MYWADELAAAVTGPQVVNDSKTPSGTVHVGSLRGVVLHDAIARALRDRGLETRFLYGVDDLDPMDAQALLTPDAVERYMGVPLAHVPAPEGSPAASYARHFVGQLFMGTFAGLGIRPEIYWMSDLYADGRMDPYIRIALDRAEVVRELYRRVSKVERPAGWLPVSILCENCGKIGTTLATDWDGETVAYACQPDYVTWARGCGHEGRVAPFRGRAKLPFNVDWAAKWSHFGITIEGCGIPGLFDEFDRIAAAVAGREVRGELPPAPERIFRASLVDGEADPAVEAARFRPSFRHLALLVQVPGVDLEARMTAEKGSPLDDAERAILDQRVTVARAWLAEFAPDRYRVEVREDALPAEAAELEADQQAFLGALADGADAERPVSGDAWQDLIFRTAQARELPSARAFGALYVAFLGRLNGPRAGWLLASLEPAFVAARMREAGAVAGAAA